MPASFLKISNILPRQNWLRMTVAVVCTIHCTMALRDSIRWISATNHGQAAANKCQFDDAERHMKKALKRAQKFDIHDRRVCVSYKNLIDFYLFTHNDKKAEPLLQRYIALAEAHSDFDQMCVADYLNQLGWIYNSSGRMELARSMREKSLAVAEKQFGRNSISVVPSLLGLAHQCLDEEHFADADRLYNRAVATCGDINCLAADDRAVLNSHLAFLHQREGRYSESIALNKKALAQAGEVFDSNRREVAAYLNNVGATLIDDEQYLAAEPYLRRALSINQDQDLSKTELTSVARNLKHLATISRKKGQLDDAEIQARTSLSIRQKILNQDNPQIADSLDELARVYLAQHKYKEAETLAVEAYDISRHVFGLTHTRWTNSGEILVQIYCETGRFELAEELSHALSDLRVKQLGVEHPRVARTRLYGTLH